MKGRVTMTFTSMAVNKNNVICIIRKPVEIVCIQVQKVYSRCRSKGFMNLRWAFPPDNPPQELISCRIKEVRVQECRLISLLFSKKVIVEVCYRVKVEVKYLDRTGKIRFAALEKELLRRSRPMPGRSTMSGVADLSLELLDCQIEAVLK